jgi:hypothetical protein
MQKEDLSIGLYALLDERFSFQFIEEAWLVLTPFFSRSYNCFERRDMFPFIRSVLMKSNFI